MICIKCGHPWVLFVFNLQNHRLHLRMAGMPVTGKPMPVVRL